MDRCGAPRLDSDLWTPRRRLHNRLRRRRAARAQRRRLRQRDACGRASMRRAGRVVEGRAPRLDPARRGGDRVGRRRHGVGVHRGGRSERALPLLSRHRLSRRVSPRLCGDRAAPALARGRAPLEPVARRCDWRPGGRRRWQRRHLPGCARHARRAALGRGDESRLPARRSDIDRDRRVGPRGDGVAARPRVGPDRSGTARLLAERLPLPVRDGGRHLLGRFSDRPRLGRRWSAARLGGLAAARRTPSDGDPGLVAAHRAGRLRTARSERARLRPLPSSERPLTCARLIDDPRGDRAPGPHVRREHADARPLEP